MDLRTIVEDYLQAFDTRDISKCLEFYHEDATLRFGPGLFQGRQSIEQWHKARFAADMRIIELEEIEVLNNTVVVQGVVTSKRLKAFKIGTLAGRGTFVFQQDRIKELEFEGRIGASAQIEWRRM